MALTLDRVFILPNFIFGRFYWYYFGRQLIIYIDFTALLRARRREFYRRSLLYLQSCQRSQICHRCHTYRMFRAYIPYFSVREYCRYISLASPLARTYAEGWESRRRRPLIQPSLAFISRLLMDEAMPLRGIRRRQASDAIATVIIARAR